MPRTRSAKRSPVYVDQPPAEPAAAAPGGAPAPSETPFQPEPSRDAVGQRVEAMRLDELWLESQPRETRAGRGAPGADHRGARPAGGAAGGAAGGRRPGCLLPGGAGRRRGAGQQHPVAGGAAADRGRHQVRWPVRRARRSSAQPGLAAGGARDAARHRRRRADRIGGGGAPPDRQPAAPGSRRRSRKARRCCGWRCWWRNA